VLPGLLRHREARRLATAAPPAPSKSGDAAAGDIVKWVIPSVGAFGALIGFVVESAQQSLLGLDRGDLGVTAYVWAAGQFLRAIIHAVLSVAFATPLFPHYLWRELTLLGMALFIALVTAVCMRRSISPAPWYRPLRLAPVILILGLIGCRISILEIPLARVENLLVGEPRLVANLLRGDNSTEQEKLILTRSVVFYTLLVCDRNQDAVVPELDIRCEHEREYDKDAQRLLLISAALSASIAWSVALLWRGAGTIAAVAILAPITLYAVAAPAYLYGKLVKPPSFDTALIQFKSRFEQMPAQTIFGNLVAAPPSEPASSPTTLVGSSLPASAASSISPRESVTTPVDKDQRVVDSAPQARPALPVGTLMAAIILGHDDKMLSLYVSQVKNCGGGERTYEWVPWQVPVSEVVAVREIASLDVVAERFKQQPCPTSQLPR